MAVTASADALTASARRILESAGLPMDQAATVAEILVDADLRGIHTHGVVRLPLYVDRLRRGMVNLQPNVSTVADQGGLLCLDGDNGMGFVIAKYAMERSIERAVGHGIGAVIVRRSNHFGEASYYVEMATRQRMIGLALSNGPALMAPAGSSRPYFGANPLAAGFPVRDGEPVILDMATSVVAQGRIMLSAARGEEIPLGWALDTDGKPTTDAEAALRGILLPFGGYKGSGIALMIEALTGILGGGAFGPRVGSMLRHPDQPQEISHFFLSLSLAAVYGDQSEYESRMSQMADELHALPAAEGVERVLLPGEREHARREERLRLGIPLESATVDKLVELDPSFAP